MELYWICKSSILIRLRGLHAILYWAIDAQRHFAQYCLSKCFLIAILRPIQDQKHFSEVVRAVVSVRICPYVDLYGKDI